MLAKKIGQMVLMGFYGTNPEDPWCQQVATHIKEGSVGGFILYSYNIETPEQVHRLNGFLHQHASDLPVLASVDQEGGRIQRLKKANGFHDYPPAYEVAQLSPAERYALYLTLAQELRLYGFNLNYAPLVDLHRADSAVIGALLRAYSSDPAQVVLSARDVIRAHHDAGVLTSLKHFPGHGLALNDSHLGMVDTTDTARLEELAPYKLLVEEGDVDMVMTGHLINKGLDKEMPATLSDKTIQGLLRAQIGYDGVVITDDLHMGAIQQHYGPREAVIAALKAGCDILMFSNNPASAYGVTAFAPDPELPQKVYQWIAEAIAEGEIDPKRIDESYERIVFLKQKLSYLQRSIRASVLSS